MSTNANSDDAEIPLPVLLIYDLDRAWGEQKQAPVLNKIHLLEAGLSEQGHRVVTLEINDADLASYLCPFDPDDYIVFNMCEELPGIPRSAAQVLEILERMGYRHTCASAQVLAYTQDKNNVRHVLQRHGVPIPEGKSFETSEMNGWNRFPAIVKPSLEHCSLGVTSEAVVYDREQLYRRVNYVINTFRQPALVEDFIAGREFRVSLWGNHERLQVLPPAEMDYSAFPNVYNRLLTYDSKWTIESFPYQFIKLIQPAVLTPDEYSELAQIAETTFRVLGCRDYAGMDVRLRDGTFYVLDVNPDPDISPECSLVKGAEMTGYSYGAMASHIVNLAVRRYPDFFNILSRRSKVYARSEAALFAPVG